MNKSRKHNNLWKSVENCFRCYETKCSPSSWSFFRGSTSVYLLIRFFLLCICLALASNKFSWWNIPCGILGLGFLLDILIVNTSIAFVTRNPMNNLRSFILTFFTFIQVVVIYGIFYKFLQHQFSENMCNWQVLYFSIVTITTLGYGDFVPEKWGTMAQIIVTLELLTGLFFIVGIFARIVGSKGESQSASKDV